jgi:hypothetical protein
MKPRSLSTLLLLVTHACIAAAAPDAACRADSGDQFRPLVELYTSEGCNSCPPADRWLSALRRRGDAPQRVSALAFHVDYWDYIGWKDRFAQPAFGQRQRRLVNSAGERTVYTPQVFLNGRTWRGWAHNSLPAPAPATTRLTLSAQPDAAGWQVELAAAPTGTEPARLALALYQNELSSRVTAGENRGEELRHDFVVREFVEAPAGIGPITLSHHFAPQAELDFAKAGVVALAYDARGTLLQSLTLPFCP